MTRRRKGKDREDVVAPLVSLWRLGSLSASAMASAILVNLRDESEVEKCRRLLKEHRADRKCHICGYGVIDNE